MHVKSYKVLFADDEYWTREKMARIIPWEKYSLEFLKPASDGEEVLERLSEEKPDILITDINMPYVNGVELLKKVHTEYPELITFVISGYDDFEYVRDSFLSGSIHYLMKPVGKIDLINALSKALELISQRQSKKEEELQKQQELQRASSFIKDREFSQLLDPKAASSSAGFVLNSHMEFAGGTLILVKIHRLQEFMQLYDYDMNLLSFSVKKRLQEVSGNPELLIFNHIYRSNEFLIAGELGISEVCKLAQDIIRDFENATVSPITIVASSHCFSMGNLAEAYVQDVSNLMQRSFGQQSAFIQAEENTSDEEKSFINHLQDMQIKELQGYIRIQSPSAVKKYLYENVGLKQCESDGWTYLEVRQTVRRFLNLLFEEKKLLLTQAGYRADYLELSYTCPDCKDTGYIGKEKCHCFKKAIIDYMYTQSNLQEILQKENFNTFSMDYYSDSHIDPLTGRSSREAIQTAVRACQEFTQNFAKDGGNLLLYGDTGVGKTFLTHCVAKELLDQTFSVIYFTASQLFDIFAKKQFEKDEDAARDYEHIYDCDLLLIDDLGTEFANGFTISQMFVCLNERLLRGKSTMISTNLSLDDLNNMYSERVFSRITSAYTVLRITGDDIRIQKKLMGRK